MAPAAPRPKSEAPTTITLRKVPTNANVRISPRFSKKSSSYKAKAESRIMGGRRKWKNSPCVNSGNKPVSSFGAMIL